MCVYSAISYLFYHFTPLSCIRHFQARFFLTIGYVLPTRDYPHPYLFSKRTTFSTCWV